jgi:hypothetical protein
VGPSPSGARRSACPCCPPRRAPRPASPSPGLRRGRRTRRPWWEPRRSYCTSRGHGARRPQRIVRVAAGFGRGTVFLGLGMIAGEFYPVSRLMDGLEARARILFGSLGRRLARLLGWPQLSITLTVGLAAFNLCTCSTRSHSVARSPPAERPPPRRALSCGGRFVFFSATPCVPRKPAQRHHPSVEVFSLFFLRGIAWRWDLAYDASVAGIAMCLRGCVCVWAARCADPS